VRRTPLAVLAALALVTTLAPAAAAAGPGESARAGRDALSGATDVRLAPGRAAATPGAGRVDRRGLESQYPRRTVLEVPAVDEADASIKLGLTPFHAIAPRLNALQRQSSRVSVEVIGESVRGRELYLVTVTNPETPGEVRQQDRLRRLIVDDPERAAANPNLVQRYKAPMFINNNIHGNEWEGTDAALRLVEDLATSRDPEVGRLLDRTRIYTVLTMNPDGRVGNTRANAAGFDMNRDFITASQPEVRAVRQALIDTQPLVMIDLHGYVNGTLIEPTTPPHGQNYEYDLFIKHAYPNGLAMEAAVNGLGYTEAKDGVRPVQIPFRDDEEGWDDWPPIFTPQYAAFHGAISHTIEFPLRVNNASYQLDPVELRRRTAINTDIAEATMRASLAFLDANRAELIADQIEVFRRGTAGEAQREVQQGLFGLVGPEDVYTTTFPRAYVIPVGEGQRSTPAAARLVDFLIANDVDVVRADRPFRAGSRSYAEGSYVVDMHQAKRGLANVILEAGADISDKVDAMYDISAWSHSLLWGADVAVVQDGPLTVRGRAVAAAAPTGSVRGTGDLALRLDDAKDFLALDALLDAGVAVRFTDDGQAVVPAAARAQAQQVSSTYGVVLRPATGAAGRPLEQVVVAASASNDDLYALAEMGFEVRPVTNATAATFDWSSVDVLYASTGLSFAGMGAAGQAAVRAWLDGGGALVGRGATAANLNRDFGLLTATRVAGRSDANGVVAVTNSGGPITARAPGTAFVSSPSWYTALGAEVTAEQRYATTGPLVAGHWRPIVSTGPGPERHRRDRRPHAARRRSSAASTRRVRASRCSAPSRCTGPTRRACTPRSAGRCTGRPSPASPTCTDRGRHPSRGAALGVRRAAGPRDCPGDAAAALDR
jgi:predicted deacylase